jgi:phosphate uptake regulator
MKCIYNICPKAFAMIKNLGHRKIQRVGRGSYIVSLPKEWVQKAGLEKGNEITFKLQQDSSIVLTPAKTVELEESSSKPELKEHTVFVNEEDNAQSVCRKIISLYLISSDVIRVHFKNSEASQGYRKAINNLIKNTLLGVEITSEGPNEIVLKILILHAQFPVEQAIRRMAILALSAVRNVVLALKNMNEELIQDVIDTRSDVVRLNLYVIRQLKYGLERSVYEDLGFRTPKEFLGYRIVANDIKGIADSAMNIAWKLTVLRKLIRSQTLFLKQAIDEEAYSQIFDFNSLSSALLEDSLAAMFKRDYEYADRIILNAESLRAREGDLVDVISTKKLDPNVSAIFSLILDNSRRVIEYSRSIAEVTLNRTIEEILS